MMRLAAIAVVWGLASSSLGGDRPAQFEKLSAEFAAAEKEHFESRQGKTETTDQKISAHEAWPGWAYVPRFLKLAESAPGDATAYQCCLWLFDRVNGVGNWDRVMYDADEQAWDLIAAHQASHLKGADYQLACFTAAGRIGTARERFLRAERARPEAPREERAIATLALAELLSQKFESAGMRERRKAGDAYEQYVIDRESAEWFKDGTQANGPKFKAESISLLRELLANDADVAVTVTAPYFRGLKTVGDKASKSLHALENLTIGAVAPGIEGQDLNGEPLKLAAFRGRVVLLVFWDTSCVPCMAMVPQEQALVEKYKGRPFAMLSVCTDEKIEAGRKTAKEKGMTWPCWFDGLYGPIARDYNVLGLPTIYVLDEQGRIAAEGLRGEDLDAKIAELMGKAD
jgi:thiol-disulfide isomerase/thioredoxin